MYYSTLYINYSRAPDSLRFMNNQPPIMDRLSLAKYNDLVVKRLISYHGLILVDLPFAFKTHQLLLALGLLGVTNYRL